MEFLNRGFSKNYIKALFALLIINLSLSVSPAAASAITFVEIQKQGISGVTGLNGISDVAVSADGKFVYTASYSASAVAIFQRNTVTGQLTYVSSLTSSSVATIATAFSIAASKDNKSIYVASPNGHISALSRNEVTGALTFVNSQSTGQNGMTIGGFVSVTVSPDGKSVYGIGGSGVNGLAVFSRDTTTGAITFVGQYADNVNGNYLGQGFSPTASPIKNITITNSGLYLYVTSTADNAVSLYSRDLTTGLLTLVAAYIDGANGVDGIQGASSLALSPDEKNLYVSGQGENSVAIFSINQNTGALTYVNKITQNIGGVTSLSGARSLAISPDGKYVYSSAIGSNAITAFDRDQTTGLLVVNTVAVDGSGGVDGLSSASGMSTDPLNRHLYVAGQGDQALAVFSLPTPAIVLSATQQSTTVSGPAISLDPQLELYDSDSVNLASATVTISEGFINTDLLSTTVQGGISASYNANTGVLSLTGVASLADYRATLRALTYTAGADANLSAGQSSSRKINVVVSDGDNTSAAVSFAVTVVKANTFTVNFVNWDTTVLSTQQVANGAAATAPTQPTRAGYSFTGWDVTFSNITATTTVTAQYSLNSYTVTFDLAGGTLTSGTLVQSVNYGQAASAPIFSAPAGKSFTGWSSSFNSITANTTITAQYSINSYTVTFDLAGGVATGGGALVQTIAYGQAAVAPTFTSPAGRNFTNWSSSFNSITATTTITAQYSLNLLTVTATVAGNGSISPATQQISFGSQAIFTLSLAHSGDTVSISSNCNAFLSGNQLMTSDITADCAISVTIYPAVDIVKESNTSLTVNSASHFTVSGGAGDKSLSLATVTRSGEETVLAEAAGRALVTQKDDGSYLFSASRTGRYMLTFTDAVSGELATVSFDVLPYIAFTSSQQSVQQDTATILRIWLSDEPIEYPVTVNFVATGATLSVQQFEINADDNLRHAYNVTATAATANVQLVDTNITNALVGTPALHTLTVQQALPPLSLSVIAAQNGQQGYVVNSTGGDVTLQVAELNNTAATFIWSSDGLILTPNAASATFNPAATPNGRYTVHIQATTLDGRIGQYDLTLRVIGSCPIDDCTGTGVGGIPASVNPVAQTPNRLPICPSVNISSRVGSCQTAGATALYAEVPNQYSLTLGQLSSDQSWGTGQFGIGLNDQTLLDSGFTRLGILLNFDVVGLENPGETVPVAIPLPAGTTIPENAIWRKFINNHWQNFVVDDVNKIHSAARDALGQCPGVSSNVWTEGLTEGHGCIRLTIKDGGPNDDDSVANGVIRDPGVLALALPPEPPVVTPVKTTTVKSGGGSMDGFSLIFLGLLAILRSRKIWAIAIALIPISTMAQGFYLGVEGLAVETKTSNANVTRKLYEMGGSGTAEVTDSSRNGWHLYGGFKLDNALAIELGWLDTGKITTRFDSIPESTSEQQLASVTPHSGEGLEVGLRWQICDRLAYITPSLRAGVWQMKFKDHYFDGVNNINIKDKDTVPFIGIDVRIPVNEQWSAKFGASSYFADNYNITTINLGLIYNF